VLSSFWSSSAGLFIFAALFGFLSNGYGFIKASAAKLLGVEHFADAFSWMMFIEGIGILMGPFFAGKRVYYIGLHINSDVVHVEHPCGLFSIFIPFLVFLSTLRVGTKPSQIEDLFEKQFYFAQNWN